jgi:hypothetical protein
MKWTLDAWKDVSCATVVKCFRTTGLNVVKPQNVALDTSLRHFLRKPSKKDEEDSLQREEELPTLEEMITAMEAFRKFEAVVSLPLNITGAFDSLEQIVYKHYKKRTRR